MLIEIVKSFLEKYDLLKPKNNILVAFSGGYDSMCLLDIMKKLASKYELNLYAIHLNHNWRGKESDQEEANCKRFATDVNFYSEKLAIDIPHTETAAREARYNFFQKCANKFNSKVILTAHNANDNAETIFYRIVKGTGLTGIEGIKEKRGIYYRPLLSVYRQEIEDYCNKNNLNPNVDSSNFNTDYQRNKIRYEIFPSLRKITPEVEKHLNEIAQYAKFANNILDKKLKKLEKYTPGEFHNLDKFLQNCAVHKFVRDRALDYDRKKIEDITKFINENINSKSGKKYSLTNDSWLFVSNKKIEVIEKSLRLSLPQIRIESTGCYEIGDYIFTIRKCSKKPAVYPPDQRFIAYIQIDKINFTLRQRQTGDFIHPLGAKGKQKLKKYLIGKQIPQHDRDNLVFLCQNKEILWAPGIGLSDKIKVETYPTHLIKMEKR